MVWFGAVWCKMVQHNATWCNMVQYGAKWCKMVQDGARWCKIVQDNAITCNNMQYHTIPFNTMQYNAIPCNTMQYHASLNTADGAYHCPVGSIRPFLTIFWSWFVELCGDFGNFSYFGALWFVRSPLVFGPFEFTNLLKPVNRIRIIMRKLGCTRIRTSSSCSFEKKKDFCNLFFWFRIFYPEV